MGCSGSKKKTAAAPAAEPSKTILQEPVTEDKPVGAKEAAAPVKIKQTGKCQCGDCEFAVEGDIMFNLMCHCRECARNRGTYPVQIIAVSKESFKVTKGTPVDIDGKINRHICGKCHCLLAQGPKEAPFIAVCPTTFQIEDGTNCILPDELKPKGHANYENRQYDWNDDLPKFKCFPGGPMMDIKGNVIEEKKEEAPKTEEAAPKTEDAAAEVPKAEAPAAVAEDPVKIKQTGKCQCGDCEFAVEGDVMFNLLCHCRECARNRGTYPMQIIAVSKESFKVTKGTPVDIDGKIDRHICGKCHCLLAQGPKGAPFVAVCPTTFQIEDGTNCILPDSLKPKGHANYENRQFDWCDDLPKFKLFPGGPMMDSKGNVIEEAAPKPEEAAAEAPKAEEPAEAAEAPKQEEPAPAEQAKVEEVVQAPTSSCCM